MLCNVPPLLSIVIPTYCEVENLPHIGKAIHAAVGDISYELILVDDDSNDGTVKCCKQLEQELPLRLIVRKEKRGLSASVLCGITEACGDIIVVMDADLSHPPTTIPHMVNLLVTQQTDFVLGSRYVPGSSVDKQWGWLRKLNSWFAALLALPLIRISDPMSGFFAFRRCDLPNTEKLTPIGYKIGLEILIKGNFLKISEVPIHFANRRYGKSKLGIKEQLRYLRHVRRLYQYKFPRESEFVQFSLVGSSGFIIDVCLYLSLQVLFGVEHLLARALSFWGAASWNWLANRTITFDKRQKTPKLKQWLSYLTYSAIGFCINWGSYYVLSEHVSFFQSHLFIAMITSVLMGMGFNFMAASILVFKPYDKTFSNSR